MGIEKESISFFGFEWKKIILPIILVFILLISLFFFYFIGFKMNNYVCDTVELKKSIYFYSQTNDSELLNKTILRVEDKTKEYEIAINGLKKFEFIFIATQIIDPFFPFPCEVLHNEGCRYYSNKKSFDCIADYSKNYLNNSDPLFKIEITEYKSVSVFYLFLNFLFLFLFGYLLSALFLFLFRNWSRKIMFRKN